MEHVGGKPHHYPEKVGRSRGKPSRPIVVLIVHFRLTPNFVTGNSTDTGERMSLDDVILAFGLSREELEAELAADLAAGSD